MPYGKMRRSAKRSARTTRRPSKNALTKVEKKQVKSIAKQVVNSVVESKYFNTQNGDSVNQAAPSYAWYDADEQIRSPVSVIGCMTGYNRSVNQDLTNTLWTYGVKASGSSQGMTTYHLNRIFDNSTLAHTPNLLEGSTCRPAFAQTQHMLERIIQSTEAMGTTGVPINVGLPYKIRMIRVKPRATKGSFMDVDPEVDLFLNRLNNAYGVNSDPDEVLGMDQRFTHIDMLLAKVNSRKYNVLEDKIFNLESPGTYTNLNIAAGETQMTNLSSKGTLIKTVKHNIGTEFHYREPYQDGGASSTDLYPDDGFIPEFVLFHICMVNNPSAAPGNTASSEGYADQLKYSCRVVSTFKDA
ncbi:MAG: putative capsid protein [Cressdnaviricota sp.]|nr:MAG: putative capsid protein [Cressdnaviricota sp.]